MWDPQKYTVGWICALATEFTAAKAFLEQKYEGLPVVAQHDNNSYALGRIGAHNVVIAVLPDGEYGTTPAATVARDMLHSFPNVRIGLMVGIGGGAPSSKYDVRLGDVVVSRSGGGRGGVFQYDFGKDVQKEIVSSFEHTDFLDRPPIVLRTAVSALESKYEMEGHQLIGRVRKALEAYPRLRKKYSRPAPDRDRLYRSDVIHPGFQGECESLCGDDLNLLVARRKREEDEDDPVVHYGLIASANKLMKNAVTRDSFADRGVLCFEMEAAGLMNHFPCLVVRGICDYSDSHKSKEWQGFAAMMAAAYTSDLLQQVSPSKIEAEERLSAVLDSLEDDIGFMRQDRQVSRIHDWLSPPDPSINAATARSYRHGQTGSWFLEGVVFDEWKQGTRQHLWLYGVVGCGKTVLSTTIIDSLEHGMAASFYTLKFFFDSNDSTKQTLRSLISSLLWQLYRTGDEMASQLTELYETCDEGREQLDTDRLSQYLQAMLQLPSRVNIVIDALDECTERHDLLRWMERLITNPRLPNTRFIVTGRPESALLLRLPILFGDRNCMLLDKQAVDRDIFSYVEARLGQDSRFTSRNIPDNLIHQILFTVGTSADGMFRWAALQLDALAACDSVGSIEDALDDLPQSLNETYRRILLNMPPEVRQKGIHLLQFIIYSQRPLTVAEAKDVIATQIEVDRHYFDIRRRLFVDEDLLRYGPSLMLITMASNARRYGDQWYLTEDKPIPRKVIGLAHFSVKEYLVNESEFKIMTASVSLVMTCLAHLRESWVGSLDRPLKHQAVKLLWKYSKHAEASDQVLRELISLFQGKSDIGDSLGEGRLREEPWPALYFACKAGVLRLLKRLIEARHDSIDLNGFHQGINRGLDTAIGAGHQEIVKLLLESGASPEGSGEPSPLWVVSCNGHKAIAKLLLDHGAQLHSERSLFRSCPLSAAVDNGHKEVAKLLFKYGADALTSRDKDGDRVLFTACFNRDEQMVKLLLDHGAGKGRDEGENSYALSMASVAGDEKIVKLLLEGCDEFLLDHDPKKHPLYAAARRGYKNVVGLLLTHVNKLGIGIEELKSISCFFAVADNRNGVIELVEQHALLSPPCMDWVFDFLREKRNDQSNTQSEGVSSHSESMDLILRNKSHSEDLRFSTDDSGSESDSKSSTESILQ